MRGVSVEDCPAPTKGLSEMTLVSIYLPLEQKQIVGWEYVTDKSGSGKQSVCEENH